eukprot:s2664_g16.t1
MKNSFGVDHIIKGSSKAPIVKIDLTTPEAEALAASYIRHPLCGYAHFGIPCGTSSRAREIDIPGGPRPLRSESQPEGLDDLTPKERERVQQANKVYEAACRLILLCIECNLRWTLEQPKEMDLGAAQKGFATAAEVEYPLELCKQWASIIVTVLNKTWKTSMAELPSHPDKRARAQAGKQTRKSLAFMPEWSHVETVTLSSMPNFTIGTKLKQEFHQNDQVIPQYARILRVTNKTANQEGGGDIGLQPQIEIAFGVPWSPEAFIAEALRRGHPANIFDGLAKGVKRAITKTANSKADSVALERARWFKKWTDRAMSLAGQENALHASLPPHRQAILKVKRFLVLREILEAAHYPDLSIVDDMINGFDLVGEAKGGGILPEDFQPATLTVDDLESQSEKSNAAIYHSTKSSGDPKVDAELWRKTCEEEAKGWLKRLDDLPQDGGRLSRRFAVVQSEKGAGRSPKLLGRSFDLKSAYRQLAVSDSSLRWARLAVFCPDDRQTYCFQQYSLPFGAKASVVAFLRCARMIQWLAHELDLVVSCYFDDYVCLAPSILAPSSEKAFATLLDLLGWKYDDSGDKADAMSSEVSALGVLFNLEPSGEARLEVANTQKRKEEVSQAILSTLDRGTLSQHAAAALKGRLGFAEGQLLGRVTRKLINELGAHALKPPRDNVLGDSTRFALEVVAKRIVEAKPHMVESKTGGVFFLFTDACFDGETKEGGIGGVLMGPDGCVVSWFSEKAPRDLCESFMAEEQEQAIGELEAFAVLVAYRLWRDQLKTRHLVTFIDNEGSRFLILKGYSNNKVLSSIVHEIALQEEEGCFFPWYSRVPSEANIADYPSRSEQHELLPECLRARVKSLRRIMDAARAK